MILLNYLKYDVVKKQYQNVSNLDYALFDAIERNINPNDTEIFYPQNIYNENDEQLILFFFMKNRLFRFIKKDDKAIEINSFLFEDFIDICHTITNNNHELRIKTSSGFTFILKTDNNTNASWKAELNEIIIKAFKLITT